MSTRKLPVGITQSRTEPWFRYQRGLREKPVYFYYGAKKTKAAARAEGVALAERKNKKRTREIEAARKGRKTNSNRSGVVGVSIKTERGRRRGSYYRYWWARWPGFPSGLKFSILAHGDRKAFCLAHIARELESEDKQVVEREYLGRQKAGSLRALLAKKEQRA